MIFVKPSHYDDDGYVIQWRRPPFRRGTASPASTGFWPHAPRKRARPDVDIAIEAYDECNTVIDVGVGCGFAPRGGGFVALVGVQSKSVSARLDLGRQSVRHRRRRRDAAASTSSAACRCCQIAAGPDRGAGLSASPCSPAKPRRTDVRSLRDLDRGAAQPVYNFLNDCPTSRLGGIPICRRDVVGRSSAVHASFDAGRGCIRSSAASAPSSTSKAANRAIAALTTSRRSCAPITRGHQPFLRYRRQFRPQPQLGGDPRSVDRASGAEGFTIRSYFRSTRCATGSPNFIEKAKRGPAATRCSSGGERQSGIAVRARRSARTRSGNIGSCCRRGESRR